MRVRRTWRHRERWGRWLGLPWGFGSRNHPQGPGDKLHGAHLLQEGRYTSSPAASGRTVSLHLCCTDIAHLGLNIWDFLLLLLVTLGSAVFFTVPSGLFLLFCHPGNLAIDQPQLFQSCERHIANRRRMETLRKVTELSVQFH